MSQSPREVEPTPESIGEGKDVERHYSSLLNKRHAWNNSNGVPNRQKLISVMHGITVMVFQMGQY